MSQERFLHIHEQVTNHLRNELHAGRWTSVMPGRNQLTKLLGVSGKTVDLALQQLETEGLLKPQGAGKRRKIIFHKEQVKLPSLRVNILLYERNDAGREYELELKHRLDETEHRISFSEKTLQDLGMKLKRVAEYVENHPADAWIVCAGSREILRWFSEQSLHVFALFGRRSGLPIAGASPNKIPAMEEAVDELVSLGHQRIVMLVREERRQPTPALYEQAFLDRLEHHGIQAGPYNLPEWRDNKTDFHRCLDALFQVTPPSAMFVSDSKLFVPAMHHLARKGILAPEQVSLICDDPDATFRWCDPAIAHIRWDHAPIIRRVVQWVQHVAQGREDIKQSAFAAHFVRGGTIDRAPAPDSSR